MPSFPSAPEKFVYSRIGCLIRDFNQCLGRIPESLIAFLGRFSIATVFWKSGQTKIEGFSLDIIERTYQFNWPHLSDSAVYLFREEYHLPLMSPEFAASFAALAEHMGTSKNSTSWDNIPQPHFSF
jgi:putative oxidoreductase